MSIFCSSKFSGFYGKFLRGSSCLNNLRKPSSDPHLWCSRWRPCSFFSDECGVCGTLSFDHEITIEGTWSRSDARQRLRRQLSGTGPSVTETTIAGDSFQLDSCVTPVSPVGATQRVDYWPSVPTANSTAATCAKSAMSAENKKRPYGGGEPSWMRSCLPSLYRFRKKF